MNKTLKGLILGIIIGSVLMFSTSLYANTLTQFILVNARYPIVVNNLLYEDDLPILNYDGSTYVPLRALSELLNVSTSWNETLRQVEIAHETSTDSIVFRHIEVTGSQGNYVITGEAQVFEATIQYEVEDGHFLFLKDFTTASAGAPAWGTFSINIHIPEESLPENGTLMLILFEESAYDGSRIHELPIVLEIFS